MPNKTTKRARRAAANIKRNTAIEKDDGTRWIVIRNGRPVYPSHGGTTKHQARHLANGLVEPAEIIQVNTNP